MEEQKRVMDERKLKLEQLEQDMDMQLKTQKQIIEAAIDQQKQVAEQQKQAADLQKQAAAQQSAPDRAGHALPACDAVHAFRAGT